MNLTPYITQLLVTYSILLAVFMTYEDKSEKYTKIFNDIMEYPKIYSLFISLIMTCLSAVFSLALYFVK